MPTYQVHIATTPDAPPPPAEWSGNVEAETPEAGLKEVLDDLHSAVTAEPVWVYLDAGERVLATRIPAWGGDD
jgi:hypothetical protein